MGFMESYKRLEKLCRDMFQAERPVKAYIEMMKTIPFGAERVRGWESDLRKLKHYHWIRNRISHEPGYTEENMCSPEDARWLEEFCDRILHQTDPLALYHKATKLPKSYTQRSGRQEAQPWYPDAYGDYETTREASVRPGVWWLAFAIVAVAVILCLINT